MQHNYCKTFGFLLKLLLMMEMATISLTTAESIQAKIVKHPSVELDSDSLNFNHRISKIEAENQNQKREIALLKSSSKEDRKVINKLNGRVAQLEALLIQNETEKMVLERDKRPFRLLPLRAPGEKGKLLENEVDQHFHGPAANCNELGKLGYTLNRYYFVNGKEQFNKKIKIVYCQFQHPLGSIKDFETVIGNVEVKTKSVHFYVQKMASFSAKNALVPFEVERLNVGGAFNLTTGFFTAPVPGIYHFEFSGIKDVYSKMPFYISIQLNGRDIGFAVASNVEHQTGSLTASFKLKVGDKVNLYKTSNGVLYDDPNHYTHFTGWLVEEDLTFP